MKRILLSLSLCIGLNALSQNIYIPDDNFEQALIDTGIDLGVLDDSVALDAVDTVTSLDIRFKERAELR